MTKLTRILLLCFVLGIAFSKDNYKLSGIVQTADGKGVKKARIALLNNDGQEIKDEKTSRKGEFKFKKVEPGTYTLKAEHKNEGSGDQTVTVTDKDVEDIIIAISTEKNTGTVAIETGDVETKKHAVTDTTAGTNDQKSIDGLDTPLKTKSTKELLPQVRPFDRVDKLAFEDTFFKYESNLRALKNQIDSLKSIVAAFENKQEMPNVSRKLLDLIKVPEYQYRIELRNGTVVMGDILEESDSTLVLKTQIGKLVLKKEMVIRRDKHEEPSPKIVFLGDPFVNIYPDRQIFSGRVKNIGKKRADFVRVISNLFTQTTKQAGRDSVFVKGARIIYDSGVIA
ncbi:uncharacterized protein METZ01_LOCUS197153, partial [marine metagenome]